MQHLSDECRLASQNFFKDQCELCVVHGTELAQAKVSHKLMEVYAKRGPPPTATTAD